MAEEAVTRRLAAILAADVVGFSRMMGADEAGTLARLKRVRAELIDPSIAQSRGRIFKTTGDGLLVEFPSVVDAVQCAAQVQAAMSERTAADPEDKRIVFRVGINLGDVIVDGDDLFGDGVNVAARLEGICDAGGVYVSGSAYEQVADKCRLGFEDLGEKSVKNIARPVRVYRVLRPGEAAPCAPAAPASSAPTKAGMTAAADAPSIAVLPFQNMSGDADQEYFSDGITEDLITDLSKLSGLMVIARNSSFTYKGKPVDVREVGKRFRVSHVLEGSVRRAGGRVRITAQLLEAASGTHVWAERYDRDLQDVFAVQDEITQEIVAALHVKLVRGEQASAWRQALRKPEALDAYYKAIDRLNRITREANDEAARCFEQVASLEPESPLGHLGLAWTELSAARYGWSDAKAFNRAAERARKALEVDEGCADAHALLGYYHLVGGQHDKAIASGERSVSLNPNHADNAANLGCSYVMSGRPADAVAVIRKAIRLSPVYPTWYLSVLGFAHYQRGEHDDAEAVLKQALEREPAYTDCRLFLAAAHFARGRVEDARREAAETRRQDPNFRLKDVAGRLSIVKDRSIPERLIGVLRELGLE
ncbi:MAG TPA: tetratricopeptide repeat protein [Burkholderiales bacterium]|jgi:adenylate cyclase|nr:tetratricopeptide repeat protein [Burkholderiales bacterium]